ncbi:hypothetical protein NIIDMKKI_67420 [Mycobacterium kansasii]|uniref:Uncharacterized protein n=1 Tax=Mycobacterium kansasii TaxID=1768 RepID=A0A7G1IKJ7_MYCKA|nr:hypothetical protein NIIDMKKI_67420 [Mycobacterium kansasii]
MVGLEGVVPPPVGAFAGGPGIGRDSGRGLGGWACQRCCAELSAAGVGDAEIGGGAGDGDDAAVVAAVVIGAKQYQVGYKSLIYLLLACILPVWRW